MKHKKPARSIARSKPHVRRRAANPPRPAAYRQSPLSYADKKLARAHALDLLLTHSLDTRSVLNSAANLTERVFDQVENMANVGTWEYNLPSDTILYSRQLALMLGLQPISRPIPLASLQGRLPVEDMNEFRRRMRSIARNCQPEFRFSARPWLASQARRTLYTPIYTNGGTPQSIVGITQDVSLMTAAEEEMRRLSHRLITAQNDEQRRLSRTLHETASQTLAAIKLTLGKAARLVRASPRGSSDAISAARTLVDDALREVRSVSALLHPPLLEEAGLAPVLETYVRNFADRSGLRAEVLIPENLHRMSHDQEITLFRVVQESLTNVHRHAKAQKCVVRITQTPTSVSLEVADDGIGIRGPGSIGSVNGGHGVGIAGMRERVQLHNGTFQVRAVRRAGTRVSVELPIQHRQLEPNHQEMKTCHQPQTSSRTFRPLSGIASKSRMITASFDAASAPSSNSNRISKSPRRPAPARKRSSR